MPRRPLPPCGEAAVILLQIPPSCTRHPSFSLTSTPVSDSVFDYPLDSVRNPDPFHSILPVKMVDSKVPQPGPAKLKRNAGPDEWLEAAKDCKYLSEPHMKQLCEMVKEFMMEGKVVDGRG